MASAASWVAATVLALRSVPAVSAQQPGAFLHESPPAARSAKAPAEIAGRHAESAPSLHDGSMPIVVRYLNDFEHGRYADAFTLLDAAGRAYHQNSQNLASIYQADAYHLERFQIVATRSDGVRGSVYYARERARFRDHAHDVDLVVTATVPIGVVREAGALRIKDPGHPQRAFAAGATGVANGLQVVVKKVSFFERRIEVVVRFANHGQTQITLLPYGKSLLRDRAGRPFRIIESRDWSLTDKILFEGVRLPPSAQYTGTLTFAGMLTSAQSQSLSLTIGPLVADGADAPFMVDVREVAPLRDSEVQTK